MERGGEERGDDGAAAPGSEGDGAAAPPGVRSGTCLLAEGGLGRQAAAGDGALLRRIDDRPGRGAARGAGLTVANNRPPLRGHWRRGWTDGEQPPSLSRPLLFRRNLEFVTSRLPKLPCYLSHTSKSHEAIKASSEGACH